MSKKKPEAGTLSMLKALENGNNKTIKLLNRYMNETKTRKEPGSGIG
ncbi:MAG: hypothetical protein ACXAC6_03165 [Candidatus Hodarchaeales archaeon]|jgi:hypothetical protein